MDTDEQTPKHGTRITLDRQQALDTIDKLDEAVLVLTRVIGAQIRFKPEEDQDDWRKISMMRRQIAGFQLIARKYAMKIPPEGTEIRI